MTKNILMTGKRKEHLNIYVIILIFDYNYDVLYLKLV